jgi:hypothetical protein
VEVKKERGRKGVREGGRSSGISGAGCTNCEYTLKKSLDNVYTSNQLMANFMLYDFYLN